MPKYIVHLIDYNYVLQVMTDSLMDLAIKILPYIELSISLPCLLCNLYFALRFSQIATINPNLKVLLIATNLISATIALFHPVLEFTPEEWYSISKGNYLGAFLFYSIAFLDHAFVLMLDCKFMMILIERRVAFKYRADYEKRDWSLGIKILFSFFFIILMIISARIIIIFTLRDPNQSFESTVDIAIIAEQSPNFFGLLHLAPGISSILGVYELTRLLYLTKRYKYAGSTLSESFEIKQTAHVVEVLKPLLWIYCFLTVCALVTYSFLLTIHYGFKYHTKSNVYLAITNLDYLCATSYGLFSTIYMLFAFKALRRLILRDIGRFLCIKVQTERIKPREIDKRQQTDDHFDYLKSVWKSETVA